MVLLNWVSVHVLHFSKAPLYDYIASLSLGHPARGAMEVFISQLAHFVWLGILGSLFAFLTPYVTSRNYLFRGWLYATTTWLVLLAMGSFFRIPFLWKTAWETIASNLVTASVWGLSLASVLERMATRAES